MGVSEEVDYPKNSINLNDNTDTLNDIEMVDVSANTHDLNVISNQKLTRTTTSENVS